MRVTNACALHASRVAPTAKAAGTAPPSSMRCIAPSISSPLPGMPHGKPAGVFCSQLTPDHACTLFGHPERPAFCSGLQPSPEMCGGNREAALAWLTALEVATQPA